MEHAIETHALRKHYSGGRIKALQDVTLNVPKGCCFGLLGPNGAGKSTLVKTLLSIVHPTSGSATILGQDIRHPEARRRIGYLPEGHQFPRYLSGAGVCHYFGRLSGLSGRELKKQTEEKLEMVGMLDRSTDKITKYSKGMKQRIGLAQSMLGDPDLIFLDEPTDGVDPMGRKEIRDVIRRITDHGVTVFLNSHLLGEVELICDQLAILDKGNVIQEGSVAAITSSMKHDGEGINVAFRTGPVPQPLAGELSAEGAHPSENGELLVPLASENEISGVVDRLRSAGVQIFAVTPVETKLEDAFIQLIQEQEDEGKEASHE